MAARVQKICLLAGLAFAIAARLTAQEHDAPRPPRLRHELGVNATALLDKVFRFELDSAVANPYLLTYRFSMGRVGFHLGAGGSHHARSTSQEGFKDSDSEVRTSFDARLGVDWRVRLGRRFAGTFGLDGIGKWRRFNRETDSGFDVITRTDQFDGWGGGPAVGLTFWINRRLGLSTEAAYYFLAGRNERARQFKNFPELNDEVLLDETQDFITLLPASLFLIYHF